MGMFDYKVTQSHLENIIRRIKQPLPPPRTTRFGKAWDMGLDALGIGSRITDVQEDKTAARLELQNWVNDPRNIVHFRGLAPSQQEGIRSLMVGDVE